MQTPQRFRMELSNDPLGNHAISQYDVINHGKDGIGAVSSSGQGSLWRVEALKGQRPDGKIVDDPAELDLVGKKLGFRSEMLIEDTHTSIELFRQVGCGFGCDRGGLCCGVEIVLRRVLKSIRRGLLSRSA